MLFKKIFCKHKYKIYDVCTEKVGISRQYRFYYACINCGKEVNISEGEIIRNYRRIKNAYKKNILFGGDKVGVSSFCLPVKDGFDIKFDSESTTLLLEEYEKIGIDLREIEEMYSKGRFVY